MGCSHRLHKLIQSNSLTHLTAEEEEVAEGEEEEAGEGGAAEEDTKIHLKHVVPLCSRWWGDHIIYHIYY